MTIDPRNGYIRAMASSGTYGTNKFNYAAQGHRQPGSTFKVWVLMTALRNGVDPDNTTYDSHPSTSADAGRAVEGADLRAQLRRQRQPHQATLQSDNTVYAQLDLDLRPEQVRKTAYDLGITPHLNAYPAEGLGGLRLGVSPLEMANAYATIASGGSATGPSRSARSSFPTARSTTPAAGSGARSRTADSQGHADPQKNIQERHGSAADVGCPAAGKTGTTDSFTDAWFVGFTPRLSTAVWVGYPNQRVVDDHVPRYRGRRRHLPARIWHDYMAAAKGCYCGDFPQPKTPFQAAPFFGKYASTGGNGQEMFDGNSATGGGGSAQGFETNGTGGGGGGSSTGGGGGKYDKRFYASPPQQPPHISH